MLALVAVGALVLPACHGQYYDWDSDSDLIVSNDSHCDLAIFIDGARATSVDADHSRTVHDIGDGRHTLEARDSQDRVVERRVVDLNDGQDYYWRIESC